MHTARGRELEQLEIGQLSFSWSGWSQHRLVWASSQHGSLPAVGLFHGSWWLQELSVPTSKGRSCGALYVSLSAVMVSFPLLSMGYQ